MTPVSLLNTIQQKVIKKEEGAKKPYNINETSILCMDHI